MWGLIFQNKGRGKENGFSLLELLMCVAIVSILCSICIVGYQGSLDTSDMKTSLPSIARELNEYQKVARDENKIVTVEFMLGTPTMRVIFGTGDDDDRIEEHDFKNQGLLKRKLVFRKYRWPDGASMPATYTYYPNGSIMGGTVTFGSGYAEGQILVQENHITWDL